MAQTAFAETPIETVTPVAPPPACISAEHTRLVRTSYALVEPAGDLVAKLFFRRLTKIEPKLERMLGGDMETQSRQLLSALALAVASLERVEKISPALKLLGVKYRGLGIEEFHYGAVGEALLWTLRQSLAAHWTYDIEDAWVAAFTVIAETMVGSGGDEANHNFRSATRSTA